MIGAIYKKEMKDALRDRKTLLLSVILPVVLILGFILFYESMLGSGTGGETHSIGIDHQLEQDVVDWLEETQLFELHKSNDPIHAAEAGEVRAALILNNSFAASLEAGTPIEFTIYADQTSNKSSQAVEALLRVIDGKRSEIVAERLTELGVDLKQIEPMHTTLQSLHAGNEVSLMMVSMLLSLVIMMSVMLGGFPIATDLFAGEKERQTMEALLITPVSRMKLITAKWLAISTLGTAGGVFSITAFLIVTNLFTEKMAEALDFGSQPLLLAISALVGILLFALLFASVQMMISIYAKSFKEAQNYLTPVMFIGMIPYFLLIGVGPNELTAIDFIIPFLNIYALLKELIYGIFHMQSILLVGASSIVMIGIGFAVASWMFSKDKWVLK